MTYQIQFILSVFNFGAFFPVCVEVFTIPTSESHFNSVKICTLCSLWPSAVLVCCYCNACQFCAYFVVCDACCKHQQPPGKHVVNLKNNK